MKKIFEVDLLRSLACLIIIFYHLHTYVGEWLDVDLDGLPNPRYLNRGFGGYVGIGMFVFLSGYVTDLHYRNLSTRDEIVRFWKKRAVRVYPLYWVVLPLYLFIYRNQYSLNGPEMLIHFAGAQMLMAPRFTTTIVTIWFVGMILLYYLIYPFLLKLSRGESRYFLLLSVAVVGVIYMIHEILDIIDIRVVHYFFVFIAGIFACRFEVFSWKGHSRALLFGSAAALILSTGFHYYALYVYDPLTNDALIEDFIHNEHLVLLVFIITMNAIVLSFTFFMFWCAKFYSEHTGRNGKVPKGSARISLFAFASYSIYLFHRPFLNRVNWILTTKLDLEWELKNLIIVLIGLPTLFMLSYYVQVTENSIMKRLRRKPAAESQ